MSICKICIDTYNKKRVNEKRESVSAHHRLWSKLNQDKVKKNRKRSYKKNNEKILLKNKIWREMNPDKFKIQLDNSRKEYVEKINNRYVINLLFLSGFPKEYITPELIEVKRLLIQTKRLCKTSQN